MYVCIYIYTHTHTHTGCVRHVAIEGNARNVHSVDRKKESENVNPVYHLALCLNPQQIYYRNKQDTVPASGNFTEFVHVNI
jgi:hypothetical protein